MRTGERGDEREREREKGAKQAKKEERREKKREKKKRRIQSTSYGLPGQYLYPVRGIGSVLPTGTQWLQPCTWPL